LNGLIVVQTRLHGSIIIFHIFNHKGHREQAQRPQSWV